MVGLTRPPSPPNSPQTSSAHNRLTLNSSSKSLHPDAFFCLSLLEFSTSKSKYTFKCDSKHYLGTSHYSIKKGGQACPAPATGVNQRSADMRRRLRTGSAPGPCPPRTPLPAEGGEQPERHRQVSTAPARPRRRRQRLRAGDRRTLGWGQGAGVCH